MTMVQAKIEFERIPHNVPCLSVCFVCTVDAFHNGVKRRDEDSLSTIEKKNSLG